MGNDGSVCDITVAVVRLLFYPGPHDIAPDNVTYYKTPGKRGKTDTWGKKHLPLWEQKEVISSEEFHLCAR